MLLAFLFIIAFYTAVSHDAMLFALKHWLVVNEIGEVEHVHKFHPDCHYIIQLLGGNPFNGLFAWTPKFREVHWAFPKAFYIIHYELFFYRFVASTVTIVFAIYWLFVPNKINYTVQVILVIPYVIPYVILFSFYSILDYFLFYSEKSFLYDYGYKSINS